MAIPASWHKAEPYDCMPPTVSPSLLWSSSAVQCLQCQHQVSTKIARMRSDADTLVLPSMHSIMQVAFSGEGTRGGTEGEQMVRDLQVRPWPLSSYTLSI